MVVLNSKWQNPLVLSAELHKPESGGAFLTAAFCVPLKTEEKLQSVTFLIPLMKRTLSRRPQVSFFQLGELNLGIKKVGEK